MSANPPQIYGLITKVMADIGAVAKTRKNEQQKYSFRGIEDFYQAAHPAMIANGVFPAPTVLERIEYRFEKTNEFGKVTTWLHVAMRVEHKFYAPDGSFVPVTTWGEGLDNSDKASNKAMSGAMKYALIELFCVPTQDVEDADRTSPEAGTRRHVARIDTAIPIAPRQTAPLNNEQGDNGSKGQQPPAGAVPIQPLPPLETLVKEAEANVAVKPAALPADHIEDGQTVNFHVMFKDALKPALRKKEKELSHVWLKKQGIVDGNGEPTAKAILKQNFYQVREEAIQWASEQQP